MAQPISPRSSVHKRAQDRAAALERLEPSSPSDQLNGKPALQRVTTVETSVEKYDVALLQAAIETRELKNQLADAYDETGRLRAQVSALIRENEKLKREREILGSNNAGASRDATLLAEVQMQLVDVTARNAEQVELNQALEQAVAARDSSIMRAVAKIKEMDALITSLRAELSDKEAELKDVNAYLAEANRKGELAKLVARQYRELAEKLKLTEWKLVKAEEMMRGTSAAPSSPLSLGGGAAIDSPPPVSATPPVIPPKPKNRLSMHLQSGSMIAREAAAASAEVSAAAVAASSSASISLPADADAKPASETGGVPSSRSAATAAINEILNETQTLPEKEKGPKERKPIRSSTLRVGRYDEPNNKPAPTAALTASSKPSPAAGASAASPESPKKHGKKHKKGHKDKERHKEKQRLDSPNPPGASASSPDMQKDASFRSMLATYMQEKAERNALQQSSPAIKSPRAIAALGSEPIPIVRTFVDFTQNACKLRVHVHNGVNFPPCSPYIVVRYGTQRRTTKIIIKTGTERAWDAEPSWDESMVFNYQSDASTVLSVEAFTKGGASDKPLGSVKINLADYSAFTLPRQFLLVSDILSESEASTELRSVRLTLDWHDEQAEGKRRHEELARSRGLFDTVRGSLIMKPERKQSLLMHGHPSVAESSFLNAEMCDGANSTPPEVDKVVAHVRGATNLNVRGRNDLGQTYLQIVCLEEHPDIVAMLLKKGSLVDNQDSSGLTPLHTASSYGRLESARLLLSAGANAELLDHAGNSPLHLAALQGHFQVARLLMSTAKSQSLSSTDIQGLTPLHKAAFGGNRAICELLVDKEVNVNCVDSLGNTPLLLAELGGKTEVSDYLLTKGADFSHQNKAGETILWAALVRGDVKRAAQFIKQFNLSVNAPAGAFGNTLLHTLPLTMEEAQVIPLFTFLIQNGANVNAKNNEEKTPLFHAAYRGYAQCCKLLIYAGASATATDKAGNTPLHFCSTTEVARLLIPKGARANVKNKQGNTPLHAAFAFFRKDGQLIDYLMSKGSGDALAKNLKGLTASEVLHTGVIRKLCVPHAAGDEALPECGGLLIKGDLK